MYCVKDRSGLNNAKKLLCLFVYLFALQTALAIDFDATARKDAQEVMRLKGIVTNSQDTAIRRGRRVVRIVKDALPSELIVAGHRIVFRQSVEKQVRYLWHDCNDSRNRGSAMIIRYLDHKEALANAFKSIVFAATIPPKATARTFDVIQVDTDYIRLKGFRNRKSYLVVNEYLIEVSANENAEQISDALYSALVKEVI